MLGEHKKKDRFRTVFFSIQSEGLVWNHRAKCGVYNLSHSDGMAYSLLAHRLHGGTSCYVPSLTERSRSNLHSLADKQACRLASLDYHAIACIFPFKKNGGVATEKRIFIQELNLCWIFLQKT